MLPMYFCLKTEGHKMHGFQKLGIIGSGAVSQQGASALCFWSLCSKPKGGRRIKRKQNNNNIYIYICLYIYLYCVLSFSFWRLRDSQVPGEVKKKHTCMLERQRASKGKREKTKHDSGRGVIARCLRAVNHGRKQDDLLWSDPQSEKWNGNEGLLFPATNKCTGNLLTKLVDWNRLVTDVKLARVRLNTGKYENNVGAEAEAWGLWRERETAGRCQQNNLVEL